MRDHIGLGDLPCRRIGHADVAYLAGADEVVEGGQGLLDRRVDVPVMQPVEVDVIGPQPAQRVLAGGDDRLAPRASAVRIAGIEIAAELRGDDQAIALGGIVADMVADDLFGVALGVAVRGVDEVAAEIDEPIDDLLGFLDARPPAVVFAEGHGPQAHGTDPQARPAEGDVVVQGHRIALQLIGPARRAVLQRALGARALDHGPGPQC